MGTAVKNWKHLFVSLAIATSLLAGGGVVFAQSAAAASCGAGCITTFTGTAQVGKTVTIGGQAGQAGWAQAVVKDERGVVVLSKTISTVKGGHATYTYKFPAAAAGHRYHAQVTFKNTSGTTLKQVWSPWTLTVVK